MRKDMDVIYTIGNEQIRIEQTQKETREKIIQRYIMCRKVKHMTQADLARRAGIPRSNITRFESGTYNPSLEMLVRIAAALGMRLVFDLTENEHVC